jgi:hypothetical protein
MEYEIFKKRSHFGNKPGKVYRLWDVSDGLSTPGFRAGEWQFTGTD